MHPHDSPQNAPSRPIQSMPIERGAGIAERCGKGTVEDT